MNALTTEGYAGKRQVPTLEQQRLTAGLGGSCHDGFEAFEGFLRVWSLANGRLEHPKNRGLCAGKRQAAALEQQRLTATRRRPRHGRPNNRGLCRQMTGRDGFEAF